MDNKKDEPLKLNENHQEQNKRALEANKKMPKATPERFKEQAEQLREFRRQNTEDNKKPSITELVAQHFADLINAAEDRKAKQIQKEARFKNGLGVRLKVSKPDNADKKNNSDYG